MQTEGKDSENLHNFPNYSTMSQNGRLLFISSSFHIITVDGVLKLSPLQVNLLAGLTASQLIRNGDTLKGFFLEGQTSSLL
jgi:hypothetical protein